MDEYVIEQFMWSYQPHFRIGVEVAAKFALEAIGFFGEPKVILIGFQVAGEHKFEICIEPENGPYAPLDLQDVVRRGSELYAAHPRSTMIHSVAHHHEQQHRQLRDQMRAKAIEEALAANPVGRNQSFFASGSVRVGDYEVHTVLGVRKDALECVPKIETEEIGNFPVFRSLVHAVIDEVIRHARRALYIPDAGSGVISASTDEIVRSATESMVRSILYCTGFWFGGDNHLLMSRLSALPYEGRSGSGRIIISRPEDPAVEVFVKLRDQVEMKNTSAIRKLLEASGTEADLLSDGQFVYGLGVMRPEYDVASETVLVIGVTQRGVWELSHAGIALLTVQDGIPHLPTPMLNEDYFEDLVERFFPDAEFSALLSAARAAGDHRHGAMLIISADAIEEAQRLSPQAWSIEPTLLTAGLLTQLTDMDGGVLVDPQGRCHAIGVILDGKAQGKGDPARGSRFNNAVRYLGSNPPATIVIVYSADGTINILPQLHPRVDKAVVTSAVDDYLAAASTDPLDVHETSNAWDVVKLLCFYLSDQQCEMLNQARVRVDEWEEKNLNFRIVRSDLIANPDMNDSYWL
ncbi:hypothetical protein OG241_30075 [Streptomyces sp. NBC_01390]|uniref:hypothetical protein n=1 Tax=Streptomyces sp. NBC_01390 TaxID=2903850 RepID=UPI003247FE1C